MNKNLIKLLDTKTNANNGCYPGGKITGAFIFDNNYGRQTLGINTSFWDGESLVELIKFVPTKFYKGSEMYEIMADLDMLPEVGQSIDINKLVGKHIKITVENNEKNGKVYSNIVRIEKDDEADEEVIFEEDEADTDEEEYTTDNDEIEEEIEEGNDEISNTKYEPPKKQMPKPSPSLVRTKKISPRR